MNLCTIVKWSFITSFILAITGAYLKIMHYEAANAILITGILATLIFIITAIIEIRTSTRISTTSKNLWTIALILFGGFTGFIYFFIGRKRIADQ
ncbi:GldL-related protein [Flavihumibacter cheonanensis]|uniref:GldL-related protein n=1 Tax=Flavihumibacter cheonanensis TaxID=1442385 RepID=UPI0034DB2650